MSDTVEIIVKLTDQVSKPAKKVEKELTKFQKAEKKTQASLKMGKAACTQTPRLVVPSRPMSS